MSDAGLRNMDDQIFRRLSVDHTPRRTFSPMWLTHDCEDHSTWPVSSGKSQPSLLRYTLLIAVATALSACSPSLKRDGITVHEIASETGLALPTNARVTHFAETPPMDPTWVARVTLPQDLRRELLLGLGEKRADKVTVRGALSESTSWWKPRNIILDTRYLVEGASIRVIVSDESDQLAVYIERNLF